MTLKLNRSKMATFPRGSIRKWYTADFGLLNIHVYDDDHDRWHYRITSLTTWDSTVGYLNTKAAYLAACDVAKDMVGNCISKLSEVY
jgi:hypothetical protein